MDSCDESVVCPECDCSLEVCYALGDIFIDNLDNNRLYCTTSTFDKCYHLEGDVTYFDELYYYLPDMQNVYYCASLGAELGGWHGPTCMEGYIWNPAVDPMNPYVPFSMQP